MIPSKLVQVRAVAISTRDRINGDAHSNTANRSHKSAIQLGLIAHRRHNSASGKKDKVSMMSDEDYARRGNLEKRDINVTNENKKSFDTLAALAGQIESPAVKKSGNVTK